MTRTEQARELLLVAGTATDPRTVLAATAAALHLDAGEHVWQDAAPRLEAIVTEPHLGAIRGPLLTTLARVPVLTVRQAVERLAGDASSPHRVSALRALVGAGSAEHLPALVRETVAGLPATAETLSALPVERCGLRLTDLAAGLSSRDPLQVLFAAVAAARLGDLGPLERVIGSSRDTAASPEDLRALHLRISSAGPFPAPLVTWAAARRPAAGAMGDVVLSALAGQPLPTGAVPEPGWPALPGELPDLLLPTDTNRPGCVPGRGEDPACPTEVDPGRDARRVEVLLNGLRRPTAVPRERLVAALARADRAALLDVLVPDLLAGGERRSEAAALFHEVLTAAQAPPPVRLAQPPGEPSSPLRPPPSRAERYLDLEGSPPPPPAAGAGLPPEPVDAGELPRDVPGWGRASRPRRDLGFLGRVGLRRGGRRDERAGAPVGAQPATAEPTEPTRHLQAEVVEQESGVVRRSSFRPGAVHRIGVSVEPVGDRPLTLAAALPESLVTADGPFGAVLDVELVAAGQDGTTRQRAPLLLPPTGPSAQVQFTVSAPASGVFTCSVLVFQGARLLQSAELTGPVAELDAAQGGETLRLLHTAELQPPAPEPLDVPAVDLSLSFHVGRPGEALLAAGDGRHRLLHLEGLDGLRAQMVSQLRTALAQDAATGASPGSPQQVELLGSLARIGNALHQTLAERLDGAVVGDSLQVITPEDTVVPLELVYDRGYPTRTAGLCHNWLTALRTGSCTTCGPRDGVDTVCPLGFWGLRLVLERQLASATSPGARAAVAGQPRAGAQTLPPLDRVLFAASARVDKVSEHETARTRALLEQRLGEGCLTVSSWDEWPAAVRDHRPGVMLTLPHAETTPEGLGCLEIGEDSLLDVPAVSDEYVVPPGAQTGPVVLLLGCNTAVAKVPWQSAAAQFRRRGAAVVVGTLAESLGRQSAPMARHLTELLWGPDAARGATIGEVMREVRRRLLADGATLGLSLVAFGHAGWRVPAAAGAGPPSRPASPVRL